VKLDRPLVWTDTETTGSSYEWDRIVQIAVIKDYPDGSSAEFKSLVNPGEPIPPEITEIHHITDAMVKNAPTFAQLAKKLYDSFLGCDGAGYNFPFDRRMYKGEFARLKMDDPFKGCRIVDAHRIHIHYNRRRLIDAILHTLGKAAAQEFEAGAHDAMVDIAWTRRLFHAQTELYGDLPQTVEELDQKFFWTPDNANVTVCGKFIWRFGVAHFNFGQYARKSLKVVAEMNPGYLKWIVTQGSFNDDIKEIAQRALQGEFPIRKAKEKL